MTVRARPGQQSASARRIEPRRLVLLRKPEDAEARPVAVLRMSLLMATRIRVGMATN